VSPAGGRLWRFKYRFAGKERRLALGTYPEVGILLARERLEDARKLIAAGVDPSEQRKSAKLARLISGNGDSFGRSPAEWFNLNKPKWASNHSSKIIDRLERDIFPWLGKRHIKDITAPELLAVLTRIEARGAIETVHRALQNCGQVLRYGEATGRGNRDFTPSLRGALAPKIEKHYAAITEPAAVGVLMRAIDSYPGSFITRCALLLAALTFVRSAELRSGARLTSKRPSGASHRIG
jgi:integrase